MDGIKFKSSRKSNSNRSLARHSSFQDICAVAEIEHQKLSLTESHNSAPPFNNLLCDQTENSKTDFKNLNLNTADTKINSDLNEIKPQAKVVTALKPNLKVINLPKSTPNVPCILVNNVPVDKGNFKYSTSTCK